MSGLDLYEGNTAERMSRLEPRDAIEPGIFEGFIRGTGMETMRQLARTGRAVGMGLAAVPIVLDEVLAKDNLSGVTLTDRYFKALDETAGEAVRYWTPEPGEVGVAGQVAGTLISQLPLVMNPATVPLAIANMQLGTAQDLIEQHGEGVTATQAVAAGTAMGAGLGVGIWMPILGQSLWQRVLLGGAGFNVLQGAAMRGAAGKILEGTPAAEQFKALDALELTIDLLLGAGFGGIAHLVPAQREQGAKAWKAIEEWGKNMRPEQTDALAALRMAQHSNVDTLPGKPTSPEAMNAHVEKVKTAVEQTLRGEPVNVETVAAKQPEGNRYIIDNAINAEGPTEIRVVRDANGNVAIDDGAGLVDVTGMIKAGQSMEEAIARTFGDHPQGTEPDLTKVRPAEIEQKPAAFEPVPERFVEAQKNADNLMAEAERIRVAEGLPPPPDNTPPGPSKVYTAVKDAFQKVVGDRLGTEYPDDFAKTIDAFYQAMARRTGRTVDQLLKMRPVEITGDQPGVKAMLEQSMFDIGQFNVKMNAEHPDVHTGFVEHPNGVIGLETIEAREGKGGQGLGTKAMQDVVKTADQHGRGILLMASPKDGSGLSLDKLVAWYRRFGFEPLPEQEYSNATIMYREANEKAQASTQDSQGPQRSSLQGADQATPRTLYQEASPRWYSELTRQVENLKQETAPAAQWKGMLKNMKGVKAEEIEWTGLNEWLDMQQGKVTRQQILDYLNNNGVKVEEVMKGGTLQIEPDELIVTDQGTGWAIRSPDGRQHTRIPRSADVQDEYMAREYASQMFNQSPVTGREQAPKFGSSSLQLPGAKPGSYRELLLTLPTKEGKGGSLEDRVQRGGETQFTRSHWDEPNVLAHVRFNERTTTEPGYVVRNKRSGNEGEVFADKAAAEKSMEALPESVRKNVEVVEKPIERRVLFVEEIQSDWAQKGKKQGFADQSLFDQLTRERNAASSNLEDATANVNAALEETWGNAKDAKLALIFGKPRQQAREYMENIHPELNDAQMTAIEKWLDAYRAMDKANDALEAQRRNQRNGIPPAPFVQKTDSWAGLVIKRMIRYAAENGFDRVAWTRGEQQVERYTNALRKVVDGIEWEKTPEGVQIVGYKGGEKKAPPLDQIMRELGISIRAGVGNEPGAWGIIWRDGSGSWYETREIAESEVRRQWQKDHDGDTRRTVVVDTRYGENELSDAIGKTLAEQIRNDPGQKGVIEGNGIRVDDTGMAGFYDRIVPKIANDILKKLGGGKVSEIKLERGDAKKLKAAEAKDIAEGLIQGRLDVDEVNAEYGLNIDPDDIPRNDGANITRLVNAFAKELREGSTPQKTSIQPSFDITPELKAKAMEGLPLFQKGGDQPRGYFEYGDQKPYRIGLTEDANKSTPIHEAGHFFLQMTKDLAMEKGAPLELKADVDAAFKWLGIEQAKYDQLTFEEQRPYHEKWARGFEAYVREGRAPVPELKSIFERFKEWLMEVYRTLTQLGVKLDDDVRGVMDRMLGGERQVDIQEAKVETKSPLLKAIKELGGMDKQAMEDITGEKRFGKGVKGIPWGLFKEGGKGLDDLASQLRDQGWPIPEDDVDGGVQTLKDLVKSELEGDRTLRAGEDPQGKSMEEADAEQIMAKANEDEQAAAEKHNFQNTPEYQAEIARIRSERDWALSKALAGEGDAIGAEARRVTAENPDMAIEVGVKEDGTADTMTAREYLDEANAEYEQALKDAELYREAGDCMLGVD